MDRSPKLGFFGVVLAIGLVFGDIGTSPLYVLRAAVSDKLITRELVYGVLSLIFWTLTLIATIKYIVFVIRADNQGEGGILALYSLVRRKGRWVFYVALVGFCGLLAEAVITPAISVLAAVEGLSKINRNFDTTTLACIILVLLFLAQNVGSSALGKTFGVFMVGWFALLFFSGLPQILRYPNIVVSINPVYGLNLIFTEPKIIAILGAVFLCITGVEALYSDLGHAGKKNVRTAWLFVKFALLINYFGQGAYLINNFEGQILEPSYSVFYDLFPKDYLIFIVIITTASTIIASQAVISGLFSLASSAVSLNLIPKLLVLYPGDVKGQVYIPSINLILGLGSIIVVLIFKHSWNLEHAYGLSVNLTLVCTSILFLVLLDKTSKNKAVSLLFFLFIAIELVYLKSNLSKFFDGAYFTVLLTTLCFVVLYSWNYGYWLLRDLREFVEIKPFLSKLSALTEDKGAPIFADNVIYLTESSIPELIESRIIYSLIRKKPKRALTYFFLHLTVSDIPYEDKFTLTRFQVGKIYRVDFQIGFKNRPNLQKRFLQVYQQLVERGEIADVSGLESLKQFSVPRSFAFVTLAKQPFIEEDLTWLEKFLISIWSFLRNSTLPKWRSFDLDESLVYEEKVPTFAN
ncbi:MAG: KUP/HAK/KT family potassium transporter, partial [Deltaproteobacteria bacterium]|nr:KUP/HAK/KT family potassium transporter [Deltaproteobacteria bacterium]